MRSWFIWRGEDSRNHGIILQSSPGIVRAQERVTQITVPGRSGDLTYTEDAWEPYAVNLAVTIRGSDNARSCWQWLTGSGMLTLSSDPLRQQEARVINSITLEKVSRNMDAWAGDITFWCQPLKGAIHEAAETVTDGDYIINQGDVPAKPIITLAGSGLLVVDIGGRSLSVSNITSAEGGVVIDCAAEQVTTLNGGTLITERSGGDFPVLPLGKSLVTVAADSCTIKKEVRWL